jgi:hypothetical protein
MNSESYIEIQDIKNLIEEEGCQAEDGSFTCAACVVCELEECPYN